MLHLELSYNSIMIDKKAAVAYLQRWKAVGAIEARELRRSTFGERLSRLTSLFALGDALGLPIDRDNRERQAIRERWIKLKESAQ
ncbi:MAG: hypothetical protein A2Z34_00105 [Planctomycetes bacterium RBG_16_59_8]|nr:MAG: hypothetical protein A2Z34_00105 [Planctomycetes bacterium RBG_16_59_8]